MTTLALVLVFAQVVSQVGRSAPKLGSDHNYHRLEGLGIGP